MNKFRSINYLDFSRPLVFLCGPKYSNNDKDRRSLLKKHINKTWRLEGSNSNKIRAIPIIFDELINLLEGKEKDAGIRLNIIEEIISNISYKTYIFLDSLSTSYELGQFTNFAYNTDSVKILVNCDYKTRENNVIGEYICKSFEDNFISYTSYTDKNGHIQFFPEEGKKEIPFELIELLSKDKPANNNFSDFVKLNFTASNLEISKPGFISYKFVDSKLVFNISMKTLFYVISIMFRENKLENLPKDINDPIFTKFLKDTNKRLLSSFVLQKRDSNHAYILENGFKTEIKVGDMNVDELIYHMVYLSYMLKKCMGQVSYVYNKENSRSITSTIFMDKFKFLNFDVNTISRVNNRLNYLENYGLKINKIKIRRKIRNITSYKNDNSGQDLRRGHAIVIDKFLKYLPTSDRSFAYKDKLNTKMCVREHMCHDYFLKIDINHYFESIKLRQLVNKIENLITKALNDNISEDSSIAYDCYNTKPIRNLLKICFPDYKLPIGFTTSPKISDFYLYTVDEIMKMVRGVTYTRYADDILLSSNNLDDLNEGYKVLEKLIGLDNLEINKKKVRKGNLTKIGSSFKFLGINIVRISKDEKCMKISNSYIVETSKLFCSCIKEENKTKSSNKLSIIVGRINYIKSISFKSFLKLRKLIYLKAKEDNATIPHEFKMLLDDYNNFTGFIDISFICNP